jgi:4-diphosphocytidyl-2-C-methyl-D-erythritol kinase
MMTSETLRQFEDLADGLLVRAPAKINLSLLVAGKRPDGFHEIETIMAKVNFFDEILIQHGQRTGIELVCEGPEWAPQGKDNLIYKACQMLLDDCGLQANLKITLTKNIPAGSGLGSASSDAAATLLGVSRFLGVNIKQKKLKKFASLLGSDVAFFLDGPLAIGRGKGEKIKKLDEIFNFLAILILPDVSVSTKRVYGNFQHDFGLYERLNKQIKKYLRKNEIDLVQKMCANMLQVSCFQLYKEVGRIKEKIESTGIGPLCLSGSGSSMFYLVDNEDKALAEEYLNTIKEQIGCKSIIVKNNRW